MAEYIEREALIRQIDEGFDKTDPTGEEQIGFLKCRRIAREFPAADVAPVVRGKWEIDEFGHFCSACREYAEEIERGEDGQLAPFLTAYCPNCGAKMAESKI